MTTDTSIAALLVSERSEQAVPVPAKVYLTGPQTKARYGCTYQTIWRWVKNPEMGFPQPLKINNRSRFALDELEAFERKLVKVGAAKASHAEAA